MFEIYISSVLVTKYSYLYQCDLFSTAKILMAYFNLHNILVSGLSEQYLFEGSDKHILMF